MTESKYRIPKLAVAVMVLGANGCGDDDGDSPDTRIDKLSKGVCRLVFSCEGGDWGYDPNDPDYSFTTEKECVEQWTTETKSVLADVSEKCRDTYLAYYECYVDAGCDGDIEGNCQRALNAYHEACKDFL